MRKLLMLLAALLAALLVVVSGNAATEWVEVRRAEDATLYIVPTTIRKAGDKAKLWALSDYKSPKQTAANPDKSYLSEMVQMEYDCKEEQGRTLFGAAHAGNMGAGAGVQVSAIPGNWMPVSPGSTDETLRKIACGM